MKIIAGEYKGRIIEMPKDIRPTLDKVRGALFEILKGRIEGAKFLDLYCGSGAVGIEALSRGARKTAFIDNSHSCLSVLEGNLAKLGVSQGLYGIYNKDCMKALDLFQPSGERFDIVFMDPPYNKDMAKNTLIKLSSCDILTPNAVVIAEIFKKECLPEKIGALNKIRTYKYGDTLLEFFKI
jgi:16S rRNA (guanine966-N2)-methyltransferase